MKPAPQARNSHWRLEAATAAAYTISSYVTTGRAATARVRAMLRAENGRVGKGGRRKEVSLVFSQLRAKEKWNDGSRLLVLPPMRVKCDQRPIIRAG